MRAAEYDCYHIVQLFIDWAKETGIGIDLNARDFLDETALLKAVRERNPQTVKVLIDAGASVTFADFCGHTALHKALYEVLTKDDCIDYRFVWRELCSGDVKLDLQEATHKVKQHTFLGENFNPDDFPYFIFQLKELIDEKLTNSPRDPKAKMRDFQVDVKDCSRVTEEELNKQRTVHILLENGDADINAVDSRGNTPLDLALKAGVKTKPCTIDALKQLGGTCNTFLLIQSDGVLKMLKRVIDKKGRSSLHRLAIGYKHRPDEITRIRYYKQFHTMLEGIRWFSQLREVKCRQIVEIKDNQGRTALHKAMIPYCSRYYLHEDDIRPLIGIASLLLKMGCSVNAIDNYGRTPLHYSYGPYLGLFMENGGNEDIRDIDGKSAIEMVQIREKEDMTHKYNQRGFTQYIKDKFLRLSDITELLQIDSSLLQSMHFQYGTFPHISDEKSNYAKTILSTILNKANFANSNPISFLLNKELNNFVNRIVDGIKNYDPRFECRPIFVGSAFEETKIDFPDECDFDLVLTKFSELCEVLPSPILPTGFVHLKTKQTDHHNINQKFDDFFNAESILLTNKVNAKFKLVLGEVLEDPRFLENEHLFELDWRCDNDVKDRNSLSGGLNQNSLCTNLRLTLNRPLDGHYMFKEISIDIVPCIHIENWWPEDALPDIRDDIKVDGCNLVFDQPHLKYPWIPFTDPCARISFAPIESRLIKESTGIAKAAYMIGKQLIKNSRGHTYILKTCLLYCNEALDPLHTKRTGRPPYKVMPDDYLKFIRSDMSLQGRVDELHFWVEKLLKCYLDFNLQDFCPCYMMPSFILPIGNYLKSNHIQLLVCETFYENRGLSNPSRDYEEIYHLYHSISSSETDLSLELPKPEPLLERFDREELMEKLATPLSYSTRYQAMRMLSKCPLYPGNESSEQMDNNDERK